MNEKDEKNRDRLNLLGSDRARSPENLNEHIRIATPSAWIGIIALSILVLSIFVFGFSGTVPVHYSVKGVGVCLENKGEFVNAVVCLVDPADITAGDLQDKYAAVTFRDGSTASGTTQLLYHLPQSLDDARKELTRYGLDNEWIYSQLPQYPYLYILLIRLDEELDATLNGEIAEASIIIREVRPYVYLFKNES